MLKNTIKYTCIALAIMFVASLYSCQKSEDTGKSQNAELILESTELLAGYQGGEYSISYTINNPIDNEVPSAKCDAEWIHNVSMDENKVYLEIDPNETTEERSTAIEITYGTVKTYLNVKQKIYTDPFTVEVPEETITENTARIYAHPEDSEMTYIISAIEKSQKDYLGADEIIFTSVVAVYREKARHENLSLEEYLKKYNLLLKGDSDMTITELSPKTEYYALAVGMTEDGQKTSAIIYKEFNTK